MKAKEEDQETEEAQDEKVEALEETETDTGTEEVLTEKAPEEVAQAIETVPPEKEEEAKPAAKKKTEEEEIIEERIYTIPLSKA